MSIQPAAHIRENGQNDEIIGVGNLCPAAGKTQDYGDKNMVYPACPAGLVLRS
jgi:hypothetical protein